MVVLLVLGFFVPSAWSDDLVKTEAYGKALSLKQRADNSSAGQVGIWYATCGTLNALIAIYQQNEELIKQNEKITRLLEKENKK